MPVECAALLEGSPLVQEGPPGWPPLDPGWSAGVSAALADGSWGRYHGPWCDRLREALRQSHQLEHAIVTCSGTAAVELALRGLGTAGGAALAGYEGYKAIKGEPQPQE